MNLNRRALLTSAGAVALSALSPIPARRVVTYTPECRWAFEDAPCTLRAFQLEQICEWFDVPPHLVIGHG